MSFMKVRYQPMGRQVCLTTPNIKHHNQADDLWARFKVPEWGSVYHPVMLGARPARINRFSLTVASSQFYLIVSKLRLLILLVQKSQYGIPLRPFKKNLQLYFCKIWEKYSIMSI